MVGFAAAEAVLVELALLQRIHGHLDWNFLKEVGDDDDDEGAVVKP